MSGLEGKYQIVLHVEFRILLKHGIKGGGYFEEKELAERGHRMTDEKEQNKNTQELFILYS